jgi:hypothetical protein
MEKKILLEMSADTEIDMEWQSGKPRTGLINEEHIL